MLNLQEDDEEFDDDDDEDDGFEEYEDEVEFKLKYERIGNVMNIIFNGEECVSCMVVYIKVFRFDIIVYGIGLICGWCMIY